MEPTKDDAWRAMPWAAVASEYLMGYRAIEATYPVLFDLGQVKLLVLGHAFECALKGWLILHRVASGQTIQKHGHDLDWLAKAAQPYYPPLTAHEKQIAHLTKGYWGNGDRGYEYPYSFKDLRKSALVPYVPPDELVPLVEECNRALSVAINELEPFAELQVSETFLEEVLRRMHDAVESNSEKK